MQIAEVRKRQGSEVTPVEFPWGSPIQLGKEVGGRKGVEVRKRQRSEVRGQRSEGRRTKEKSVELWVLY